MFAGNTDKGSIVSHVLSPAINARYIRVQPKTWNQHISMRIELVGCHTGNYIKQVSDYGVTYRKILFVCLFVCFFASPEDISASKSYVIQLQNCQRITKIKFCYVDFKLNNETADLQTTKACFQPKASLSFDRNCS